MAPASQMRINYLNSVNEIQDPGGQFLYLAITGWFILPFCFILDGIDTPLQWAGIDDGGGSVNYTPSTPTPTDTGSRTTTHQAIIISSTLTRIHPPGQ